VAPENARSSTILRNDHDEKLDDQGRAELNATLEESFEQVRQGKTLDGESFLAELRSRL
jgi:hypothetical protein